MEVDAVYVENRLLSTGKMPSPISRWKRPGKYCKLADTPTINRKVDDCHPEVQAIVEHKEG